MENLRCDRDENRHRRFKIEKFSSKKVDFTSGVLGASYAPLHGYVLLCLQETKRLVLLVH